MRLESTIIIHDNNRDNNFLIEIGQYTIIDLILRFQYIDNTESISFFHPSLRYSSCCVYVSYDVHRFCQGYLAHYEKRVEMRAQTL